MMPEADPTFPVLTEAQIARLTPFGEPRLVQTGEILFDQGDSLHGVYLILEGSVELAAVSTILKRGQFTGEVNQLSGRRSLVQSKACEPSSIVEISRVSLRRVIQNEAELS